MLLRDDLTLKQHVLVAFAYKVAAEKNVNARKAK